MFDALIRRYFAEYERLDSSLASAGPGPVNLLLPKDEPGDRDTALAQGAVLKAAALLRTAGDIEAAERLLRENQALLRRSTSGRASDEVNAIVGEGDWRAWELLVALVERAPDDALGYVAAGPLEAFFANPASLEFIEAARKQAKTNARFLHALEEAWNLPPEIESLLDD